MPWITRRVLATIDAAYSRVESHVTDLRNERDRLLGELKAWSTRGRAAEERAAYLEALHETLRERVTQAEKKSVGAQTAEAIYRTELNAVRLERAELLAKLTNIDIQVPRIEAPLGVSPSGGGGVDFEDMGDAEASAAGFKDMHDLPPSRPARPD
jgi:chromosome segregation ATPase